MDTETNTVATLSTDEALGSTIHSAARELGGYGSSKKAFELIGTVAHSAKIVDLKKRLADVEQERERWNGPEIGDLRFRHKLGQQVTVLRAAIALRSTVLGF